MGQSTFMIDTRQLAVMLKHSTERSLLLIDEYGKGTNPGDGLGLLGASIKSLLERGGECPKAVICNLG
jgi:DNA mismatch repair protein MSH5